MVVAKKYYETLSGNYDPASERNAHVDILISQGKKVIVGFHLPAFTKGRAKKKKHGTFFVCRPGVSEVVVDDRAHYLKEPCGDFRRYSKLMMGPTHNKRHRQFGNVLDPAA